MAANEQLFLGATAARLIVNDTLAVALVTEKPRATYETLPCGARGFRESGLLMSVLDSSGEPVFDWRVLELEMLVTLCVTCVCVCGGGSVC